MDVRIADDALHGEVDKGGGVKIEGQAATTVPVAVTNGDRVRAYFDANGRLVTRDAYASQSQWQAIHVPAANTQATATKAAAGANIRNVCTALTVTIAATATVPTAVNLQVNLIDGASGGTTYLWRSTISLPATAGAFNNIAISGLWLPGTANTALTLEFSAAGGLNTIESVSMSGTTLEE